MLAGWALAVATSLVLLRLGRQTQPPIASSLAEEKNPRPFLWWFLANLLLFSPAQSENWLWGIGIQNFMPMLWIALAILAAASSLRDTAKLVAVVVLATLASWSSGNGMLAWGLAGGVLLWAPTWREFRARRRLALLLLAAVAVVAVLYFVGMAPPNHRGAHPYDSSLAAKLHYVFAFAGAPFASTLATPPVVTATVLGAAFYLLLAACALRFFQLWFRDKDTALCRSTLPWFAIAGFAVGSGLIAACARAGMGAGQATASRYVTFALYLPLALIPLLPALKPWLLFRRRPGADEHSASPSTQPLVATIGATALVLLSLAAIDPALRTSAATHTARRQTRAVALLTAALPGHPLIPALVFPDTAVAERIVAGLDTIGYLHPRLVRSREARQLTASQPPTAETLGRLERVWETGPGEVALVGWAALPGPDRHADLVLLCVTDERGEPMIVDMAPVFSPRPDKTAELAAAAATCGWALRAPLGLFLRQHSPVTITAWAFDAEHRELFPLAGTATLGQ